MIARHRISPQAFAALPSGGNDTHVVEALRDVALSENLLLLRFLALSNPGVSPAAVEVLTEAQRTAPAVVAHLFARPWTGAWLARCSRRLRGTVRMSGPVHADLAHLGALAAVAAFRSRFDTDVESSVRGGLVVLPDLGAVAVEAPEFSPARIAVRGEQITVTTVDDKLTVPRDLGKEAGRWYPLRRLRADCDGRALTVDLDDLDPFRACHGHPVSDRISPGEFDRWQGLLEEAWLLLVRHVPWRADEVAAGVSSLVALTRYSEGPVLSATSRDAFGGLGITRPDDAVGLAATLVHELQHSKLYSLLRVVPLYGATGSQLYFSPWRRDARPLKGLYQGVYAFLGVADVLGRLRSTPQAGATVTQEFADVGEQLAHAMDSLEDCGHLTAAGTLFLNRMRTTLDRLADPPLPADVVRRARDTLLENQARWRLANPEVASRHR
ncbi:HEXXH motif domain-containing protein [Longispora urticae]